MLEIFYGIVKIIPITALDFMGFKLLVTTVSIFFNVEV